MGDVIKADFQGHARRVEATPPKPNIVLRRIGAGILAFGSLTGGILTVDGFSPHTSTVVCVPETTDNSKGILSDKADRQLGKLAKAARAAGVPTDMVNKYVVGEDAIQSNIRMIQDGIRGNAAASGEQIIPEACMTETRIPVLGTNGQTFEVQVHRK